MALPAEAFGEISPADLPAGRIFRFRESWAMIVCYEDESTKDFLVLGGERSGQLFQVGSNMSRCLTVMPPFAWFAAVEEGALPINTDHQTVVLTLAGKGPLIVGAKEGRWDDEYVAFGLDGIVDREYQPYGMALRYTQWTAELQHRDLPYRSIGRLFSVSIAPP